MGVIGSLLAGIGVALGTSWVLFGLGWLLGRRNGGLAALAVGVGFLAGQVATVGLPPFPPMEAAQRLWYLALVATVIGCSATLWAKRTSLRYGIHGLLSVVATGFLLLPLLKAGSWEKDMQLLATLSSAAFLYWILLDRAAGRDDQLLFRVGLLVAVFGTAVVAVLSGTALLGYLTLALFAALSPILARQGLTRGVVTVVALVLPGLWLIGYCYADVSPWCILLLAVAPLAALAPFGCGWLKSLLRLGAAAAPVGLAIFLAFRSAPPADDIPDYGAAAVPNRSWAPDPPTSSAPLPPRAAPSEGDDAFQRWTKSAP